MAKQHQDAFHLTDAIELLDQVGGKSLTPKERQKSAVELAGLLLDEGKRIQTRDEKHRQEELARMMHDPRGKAVHDVHDGPMLPQPQKQPHRRSAHLSAQLFWHSALPYSWETLPANRLPNFRQSLLPLLLFPLRGPSCVRRLALSFCPVKKGPSQSTCTKDVSKECALISII